MKKYDRQLPQKTYLDHSTTTPMDPRVLSAMQPYFMEIYGNPSSVHTYGRDARQAIESARIEIALSTHNQMKFTL